MSVEFDLTIVDRNAVTAGTFTMEKLIGLEYVTPDEVAIIHDLVQEANRRSIHRTAETTVKDVVYAVKIAGTCARECTCF